MGPQLNRHDINSRGRVAFTIPLEERHMSEDGMGWGGCAVCTHPHRTVNPRAARTLQPTTPPGMLGHGTSPSPTPQPRVLEARHTIWAAGQRRRGWADRPPLLCIAPPRLRCIAPPVHLRWRCPRAARRECIQTNCESTRHAQPIHLVPTCAKWPMPLSLLLLKGVDVQTYRDTSV